MKAPANPDDQEQWSEDWADEARVGASESRLAATRARQYAELARRHADEARTSARRAESLVIFTTAFLLLDLVALIAYWIWRASQ